MPRFPPLLERHRQALFKIVEFCDKHDAVGKPLRVYRVAGDTGLRFSIDRAEELLETDYSTLRVLDEAGYLVLSEWPAKSSTGILWTDRTVMLKRLASDYYRWDHSALWYKPLAERWFSLAPDTRSAIVGGVSGSATAFLLGLLALLIRGCLSS